MENKKPLWFIKAEEESLILFNKMEEEKLYNLSTLTLLYGHHDCQTVTILVWILKNQNKISEVIHPNSNRTYYKKVVEKPI